MDKGNSQRDMQHYMNVYRMAYLAEQHPMVKSVAPRTVEKCSDKSELEKLGRCTKFHRSPFNLEIALFAYGAQWTAGCIVNNTHKGPCELVVETRADVHRRATINRGSDSLGHC